jgi:CheY-like chemotaxis protein
LETQVGKGTTFGLEFPLSKKSRDTDSTRGDVLPGSGNILLVDDDETVLDAVGEMLKNLGYRVRPFSTSRTALSFYEKDHGHVDAVLLDMNMPDLDGLALFDALAKVNPAVKGYLFTAEYAGAYSRAAACPGATASSRSQYVYIPSAFICVHLRLNKVFPL